MFDFYNNLNSGLWRVLECYMCLRRESDEFFCEKKMFHLG